MSDNFLKILNFLEEIDSLKSVERKGYLKDHSRHDNPAEHTWHMMIMIVLYKLSTKEDFDLEKTLIMSLFHDVHEIYSGDVARYDEKSREACKKQEKIDAKKLFSILPEELHQKIYDYWLEFEENKSIEARLSNHFDYLQGFSQSYFSRGKSWQEMGITREKTKKYTTPIKEDNEQLSKFIDTLYQEIDNKKLLS